MDKAKRKRERDRRRFIRYIQRTYQNKITAIALVLAGLVPVWVCGDATVLVLSLMIAVPMFFAWDQWVYW